MKLRRGLLKRSWWIGLAVILVGIVVFAGCFLSTWIPAGDALDRERIRVQYTVAAIRAERVTRPVFFEPSEDGNSWNLLEQGLKPFEELSGDEEFSLPTLRERFYPEAPQEDVTELVQKIEPHFEVLKRALRRPWVEPGYSYEEGLEMRVPLLNPAITACYMLQDRAWARHEAEKPAEAVDLLIIGWGIADRIAVKGPIVCESARMGCNNIITDRLRTMLADHRLDSASLARVDRVLSTLESVRPHFRRSLQREQDLVAVALLAIEKRGDTRPFRHLDIRGGVEPIHRLSLRTRIAEYIQVREDVNREVEAALKASGVDGIARVRRVVDAAGERRNPIISLLLPTTSYSFRRNTEDVQAFAHARLAIGIARYQLDQGSFPKSLNDLVPKYLPSVPEDSYSGRPFVYLAKPESASVYAWGRDGDDDGGRSIEDYSVGNLWDGAEGDVVWTVKRRK